ncbi:MAG: glycosyltransferase [Novosphingobium sp.]
MTEDIERFDPAGQAGRISYEHLHRYALCCEVVDGLKVLDIGSGTGYGSAMLSKRAASVVAVDVDPKAVSAAKRRFKRANLTFAIADCYDLPFDDGSFDVVVANEMIEHIESHAGLLKEVTRVLVPDGVALISTPNKPVYNRYKTPNPFHISEMDIPEFRQLLERHFQKVQLVGQRMALVSASFELERNDLGANLHTARTFIGSDLESPRASAQNDELWFNEPEYVLAVVTNSKSSFASIGSTVFFSREVDLWLEHERIMAWASQLHDEDELLRADLRSSRGEEEVARAMLQAKGEEIAVLNERLGDLRDISSAAQQLLTQKAHSDVSARYNTLGTLAKLIGQLIDRPVETSEADVISALFDLQGEFVLQRQLAAQTKPLEAELERFRGELAGSRATIEQQQNAAAAIRLDVSRLHQDLAAASSQHEAAVNERDSVILQRNQHQAAAEAMRAEVDELNNRMTAAELAAQAEIEKQRCEAVALGLDLAQLQQELAVRITEAELAVQAAEEREQVLRHQTAQLSEQFTAALAETETIRSALQQEKEARVRLTQVHPQPKSGQSSQPLADKAKSIAPTRSGPAQAVVASVQDRRFAQFISHHRSVHKQLAEAPNQLAGKIGEPPRRSSLRLAQFLGQPDIDTVVFQASWVERQTGEKTTLAKYLRTTALWDIDPHPCFDAAGYLAANPDVVESGMNPLKHYLIFGWRERRNPHPLFANDWYLANNPDVLESNAIGPLEHYLRYGWREGRWPNPVFDPAAYLERYSDVARAGTEPLTHYIAHGKAEGRTPQARNVDPRWADLLPNRQKSASVSDFMLQNAPLDQLMPVVSPAPQTQQWPPSRPGDHWLPQVLRDYIVSNHSEDVIDRYWYFYSVMEAYRARPNDFPASSDCRAIVARIQEKSALAARPNQAPDATIIVPAYNNMLDTLLSIASVFEQSDHNSFEIIVADDGSSDATADLIGSIGGSVRHLRQPENLGFLRNCNVAAAQARGRTMVFLNNDTLVLPDWLEGLLAPFRDLEHVGLTGSKLINWDGTLQEAGGIYWRDGSAWNFGRNSDAAAPEFNYLKDVDYCSGASIALPAALWQQLGGFDEHFLPAYCEDADLAFRVRKLGYRSVLAPQSEVIHHEGRSHGRDLCSGIKAYQVENQRKLFERWRSELDQNHYPNAENVLRARDRSKFKRHILVVDHYVIQPDRDAGSRSTLGCIQAFLDLGWSVTFWPDNLYRDPDYTRLLQNMGVEVIYGSQYQGAFDTFIAARKDLYDAAFINRPHIAAPYIESLRRHTQTRVLFYGHDLHFKRLRAARTLGEPVTLDEIDGIKATELAVCEASDVVYYPDQEEVNLIAELIPPHTQCLALPVVVFADQVIAGGEERANQIGGSERREILFVGGFNHSPNRDGIVWFVQDVLPKIRARLDGVILTIVGSNPTAEIFDLQAADVEVTGFVPDAELHQHYSQAGIAIAPLRFGAGVKGKVIEAMAEGVPIVTTLIGLQGINGADETAFIGDDAEAFADAVVAALTDDAEAKLRALAALEFVKRRYSKGALKEALMAGLGGH